MAKLRGSNYDSTRREHNPRTLSTKCVDVKLWGLAYDLTQRLHNPRASSRKYVKAKLRGLDYDLTWRVINSRVMSLWRDTFLMCQLSLWETCSLRLWTKHRFAVWGIQCMSMCPATSHVPIREFFPITKTKCRNDCVWLQCTN